MRFRDLINAADRAVETRSMSARSETGSLLGADQAAALIYSGMEAAKAVGEYSNLTAELKKASDALQVSSQKITELECNLADSVVQRELDAINMRLKLTDIHSAVRSMLFPPEDGVDKNNIFLNKDLSGDDLELPLEFLDSQQKDLVAHIGRIAAIYESSIRDLEARFHRMCLANANSTVANVHQNSKHETGTKPGRRLSNVVAASLTDPSCSATKDVTSSNTKLELNAPLNALASKPVLLDRIRELEVELAKEKRKTSVSTRLLETSRKRTLALEEILALNQQSQNKINNSFSLKETNANNFSSNNPNNGASNTVSIAIQEHSPLNYQRTTNLKSSTFHDQTSSTRSKPISNQQRTSHQPLALSSIATTAPSPASPSSVRVHNRRSTVAGGTAASLCEKVLNMHMRQIWNDFDSCFPDRRCAESLVGEEDRDHLQDSLERMQDQFNEVVQAMQQLEKNVVQ